AAARRVNFEVFAPEHESQVGTGTVSNAKAFCPFHERPLVVPSAYIKECGKTGKMSACLTAVAVAGPAGKEDRRATAEEPVAVEKARRDYKQVLRELPGGPLHEPISDIAYRPKVGGVADLPRFGIDNWGLVFTERQQLALAVIAKWARAARREVA